MSAPPRSSTGSGAASVPATIENDTSVSPIVMTWPGITRTRCTSPPSTSRPFAELRSTSSTPWSTSTLACRFDTSGSASTTSTPASRPITLLPRRSGNSRPASGPLRTCMIAAAAPSPPTAPRGACGDDGRVEARADRRVADEQVGCEHHRLARGRRRHREGERGVRCSRELRRRADRCRRSPVRCPRPSPSSRPSRRRRRARRPGVGVRA